MIVGGAPVVGPNPSTAFWYFDVLVGDDGVSLIPPRSTRESDTNRSIQTHILSSLRDISCVWVS